MEASVRNVLQSFSDFPFWQNRGRTKAVIVEQVAPLVYSLRRTESVAPPGKSYGLALLGGVHGNEVGGVGVMHELLRYLTGGGTDLPFPILIALGNVRGIEANQRFVDADLNRSFAADRSAKWEERRAGELGGFLKDSAFLVDFHQTTEVSDRPFFIFPFAPKSLAFASRVAPQQTLVTHWGEAFSNEGMCSDEFVNAQGGVGITIELGQAGLDSYQVGLGTFLALRSLQAAQEHFLAVPPPKFSGAIFTFARVVGYPEQNVRLVPGLYNFKSIEMGEVVGHIDGQALRAEASGRILFPRYKQPKPGQDRKNLELYRVLREIAEDDLPK